MSDELRKQFTFNSLNADPAGRSDGRSSPPAEEWGVCIDAVGTSQAENAQKARWHKHINLCVPKKGTDPKTVDWTKFGMGSIVSKAQCDAAGGVFYPQLFGWMVHVHPWQTNPELVWAH